MTVDYFVLALLLTWISSKSLGTSGVRSFQLRETESKTNQSPALSLPWKVTRSEGVSSSSRISEFAGVSGDCPHFRLGWGRKLARAHGAAGTPPIWIWKPCGA